LKEKDLDIFWRYCFVECTVLLDRGNFGGKQLKLICRPKYGTLITFSVITNIYNKKTKGPTLMELFTATGKLKKFFFDN
jgi:hypothetical protein